MAGSIKDRVAIIGMGCTRLVSYGIRAPLTSWLIQLKKLMPMPA